MKIYYEFNLANFDAWSGAKNTLDELTYTEIKQLESMMEDAFGDEYVDETEINDFLWFETDTIAEWFGYRDWEAFEKRNDEPGPKKYHIYNIEWDIEEDDEDDDISHLPDEITIEIEIDENDNVLDELTEYLTDTYCWCVETFDYEEVDE